MKFSQIFFFSIISSISCAPVSIRPILNAADTIVIESSTAAARPGLTRINSARSSLSESITGGAPVPVVDAVSDNAATAATAASAAGRPPLERVQSAPSKIGEDMTDVVPIKADKIRKEKIQIGLFAGGVGGLSGGLIGNAAASDQF